MLYPGVKARVCIGVSMWVSFSVSISILVSICDQVNLCEQLCLTKRLCLYLTNYISYNHHTWYIYAST